jgi:4-carboxymuconolactone decarboxylase
VDLGELLRRLALNDEQVVQSALGADPAVPRDALLDARTSALARLAALLTVGATTESCRVTVELARSAGSSDAEIVGVLMAIAPAVGGARLVTAAPLLALAIDRDVEDADSAWVAE